MGSLEIGERITGSKSPEKDFSPEKRVGRIGFDIQGR
jgi:hypothetical protein